MPKSRLRTSRLPLPEITADMRLALTLFAAQAMRHPDTVCRVSACRRYRCCTIDDPRTEEFLCILLLDEDERRAFDAALALAEHLCLRVVPGGLGDWFERRRAAGADPQNVRAAVAIVARMLPKSDAAVPEFRAFLRDQAVREQAGARAAQAAQCHSGTESGNGAASAGHCNHSSSD
ncbi:hypothetical protein HGP14_16700 [Rhizobium sp. P32RR-XVIII]|uniref:hypothetical protein n=1 Tax=Rhizobium sp. P32RR-XVIII TaxID=2726738 RepID=UPI0014571636|nr:hypothetical protein [Rhizobium sp. P32RR-XVIII]NLS04986.1 hypothetical protein [Rhizobium sp. P32RR-XVIII]